MGAEEIGEEYAALRDPVYMGASATKMPVTGEPVGAGGVETDKDDISQLFDCSY
jgi:hypothetical protein